MDEKTLTNAEKKVAIKAELTTGANARKLAGKYDCHYTTVIKYRNELRNGVINDEVLDVADTDAHVLKQVADEVKVKVIEGGALPPKSAQQFATKVDAIVDGVSSLQLLDTEFHKTITSLLRWANTQIHEEMKLSDWRAIASQVGELHQAVFAKGGVQVNVQQNTANNAFTSGMVN